MENLVSISALVLSVVSVIISLVTFTWTVRRDRKQATLDAFNTLQEQALDHINRYKADDIRKIAENPKSDEYKVLSKYLARIEHFSVGVHQ